jgi:hypothetical protein
MPRVLAVNISLAVLITVTQALQACSPAMRTVSARNPDLFEKESDRLTGTSRGTVATAAPEVYVKQRTVQIEGTQKPNDSGSLYNPEDERNWLFTSSGPANVGRFVTITVAPNRSAGASAPTPGSTAEAGAAPATADAGAAGAEGATPDAVTDELLKGLPELAPAKPGDPALVKSFKMRIAHRYPNGDVLAILTRRSASEEEVNDLTVQARIPYDRVAAGDGLTTEDLFDVKLSQNQDDERIERVSSGWEDEYSLRLSGFSEAKSKVAMELDDRKKQLDETQTKLTDRIETFATERQQVAKQRDELSVQKQETEGKVKDLETQVKDQQETIEEQKKQLEEAKPEDKPSDGKEGSGG